MQSGIVELSVGVRLSDLSAYDGAKTNAMDGQPSAEGHEPKKGLPTNSEKQRMKKGEGYGRGQLSCASLANPRADPLRPSQSSIASLLSPWASVSTYPSSTKVPWSASTPR